MDGVASRGAGGVASAAARLPACPTGPGRGTLDGAAAPGAGGDLRAPGGDRDAVLSPPRPAEVAPGARARRRPPAASERVTGRSTDPGRSDLDGAAHLEAGGVGNAVRPPPRRGEAADAAPPPHGRGTATPRAPDVVAGSPRAPDAVLTRPTAGGAVTSVATSPGAGFVGPDAGAHLAPPRASEVAASSPRAPDAFVTSAASGGAVLTSAASGGTVASVVTSPGAGVVGPDAGGQLAATLDAEDQRRIIIHHNKLTSLIIVPQKVCVDQPLPTTQCQENRQTENL